MKWLLLLVAAAPVFGQCSYSVSPTQFSIPAAGADGKIAIITGSNCAWQFAVSSNTPWITFTSGQANNSGIGNGEIDFTVAQSTQPAQRQAAIQVAGSNNFSIVIPITQAAAVCSMTLQPASSKIAVAGGSGSFLVQTACSWTASTTTPWITVAAGSVGTGNGVVAFTADPNGCVDGRSGSITVTAQPNQSFSLTQDGSPGNLTLSPASLNAPETVSTGRLTVVTGNNCPWTAFSDASWLHLTSAPTGTGTGGLSYSIEANPGPQRTGSIHIGPQSFSVSQAGVSTPVPQLNAVVNGASFQSGAIAPGEIVSIFGPNVGPATTTLYQINADGRSIANSLAGVQVTFDGAPAALLLVSSIQINAIVPYSVAGKSATQVQVQYQGALSNALSVPVQPAAPAIFSQDASGRGTGAILNQDQSVNARLNAAARSSIIAIYLTGAGVTNPASADASITGLVPPFPGVTLPVTVTIGGITVPADQVWYSGAAPGSVTGLTQIDATVPAGVVPGPSVPVTVQIGSAQSPAGITLAVQ